MVLAGQFLAVPPGLVGQQAVAVGADVDVAANRSIRAADQQRCPEQFKGFEVAVAGPLAGQTDRVPGRLEQPVDFPLLVLRAAVLFGLEDVFELFFVDEHAAFRRTGLAEA